MWLSMRHQETVKFGILLTSFKHKQHAGASLCNQLLSHTALVGGGGGGGREKM